MMNCLLCKKIPLLLGSHPDFNIPVYYCGNCLYGFSGKISDNQLRQYYKSKYRDGRSELTPGYFTSQLDRAQEQKKYISRFISVPRSVFDVGCSVGTLVSQFEGNRYSSEYDERFANEAKSRGVVLCDGLDNAPSEIELVTSSHSLERINDVNVFLSVANYKLKARGYLFIEVPNDNRYTVERIVNAQRSNIGHLHYFSPNSLKQYLINNKFRIIDLRTVGDRQILESQGILSRIKSLFAERRLIRCIARKI